MLSTPYARPIFLHVPAIDPCRRIEIALLVPATFYALFVQIDDAARIGLQVWALLAWLWCFAKERQWVGARTIARLIWRPDAGWFVILGDGGEYPAEIRPATRVFVRLSILSLKIRGIGSFSLVIWPRMVQHNAGRRLRVVLRLAND